MKKVADISAFEGLQQRANLSMNPTQSVFNMIGMHPCSYYKGVPIADSIREKIASKGGAGLRWRLNDSEIVDCVTDGLYDQTMEEYGWKDNPSFDPRTFDFEPIIDNLKGWVRYLSRNAVGTLKGRYRNPHIPEKFERNIAAVPIKGQQRITEMEDKIAASLLSKVTGGQY